MQTSQVSNAANILASTPSPSKQPEANASAEPFGKVLSREVNQRNGNGEAHASKEPTAPPAQQAPKSPARQADAKAPSKPAETKPAKDGKQADKAHADEEAAEASAALSDELLSLVANVNGLNGPAGSAKDTDAGTQPQDAVAPEAAKDLATAILPAGTIPAEVKPADTAVPVPTSAADIGTQIEATTLSSAGSGIKQDKPALHVKPDDRPLTKPEVHADSAAASVKAEDVNAQAANQSASTKSKDFAATMNETLSGLTAGMQPVQQQAGLHAVQQHGAQSAERLTPRVGTPAWDQALGQKIVWMAGAEQQSASLTLNPPDLGPLQVVLNVSNSQANATFIAAQPEVRQALEAALPKLRDMLGEAGIQLGQASVNSGTPNQQSGFEQQSSQAARGHGGTLGRDSTDTDSQVRVSRVQPTSSGLGLVDTFA